MNYPKVPDFDEAIRQIKLYAQLKTEYGSKGVGQIIAQTEKDLKISLARLKKLSIDQELAKREPDNLDDIRALRPSGPRRFWENIDRKVYRDKLEGALLGRMSGCILGAPVEFWSIEKMQALAEENGENFPPTDYWSYVPEPRGTRYEVSYRDEYTKDKMTNVAADDDIVYTLLGLLILEEYGPNFTVEDVGKAWVKYVPHACTAEEVALNNLKSGISSGNVGGKNNPFCEWIGADIRADPWGYVAPGWPERAAEMAYRDAYISHRRQGIYGEMYFAAAIAAAFHLSDPVDALKIGLTEIPKQCALAKAVRWALKVAPEITDYKQARAAVESKFKGMHEVHTINNACLTIWGITIGGTDFSRVISETVAMGMDNDCTAATAGSIVGAVVGKSGIPEHWYVNFNNTIQSYLVGKKKFAITAVLKRFEKQALSVYANKS